MGTVHHLRPRWQRRTVRLQINPITDAARVFVWPPLPGSHLSREFHNARKAAQYAIDVANRTGLELRPDARASSPVDWCGLVEQLREAM